jgi:dTDP-4-dehydrorhamnose reductase
VLCEFAADIPLLFFSTDLVFDGAKGNYNESDAPNPLTVYAETKVAAEQIVLANPKHTVIRASLNAGRTARGNAFNEQWLATWQRGEATKLFVDEFRSPIAAEITARAVWELVAAKQPGLFHLGGSERLSRFEIGRLLLTTLGLPASAGAKPPEVGAPSVLIEPGSIRDYTNLRRAPDTSLDSSRIQRLLSFPLPRFSDWLREHPRAFTG